jgi:transcriptional regulator with XRE-family HTH domain
MAKTVENFARQGSLGAFGAALRKRREALGLSLEALAKLTGISKPYLANIETARTPGPPAEAKLRVLEKALAIGETDLVMAADWLRTPASVRALLGNLESAAARAAKLIPRRADGAIDLDALVKRTEKNSATTASALGETRGDHAPSSSAIPSSLPLRIAPIINRVAAGGAVEHGDLDYPAGVADAYVPIPAELHDAEQTAKSAPQHDEQAAWKNAFACKVQGSSMEPLYKDGDLVVVAALEARDGEDCLVRLGEADNFATTLKRIYFLPDHSGQAVAIRLVPRNPAFSERVVMLAEVSGLYPVIYKMSTIRGRSTETPAESDFPAGPQRDDGAYGDRGL